MRRRLIALLFVFIILIDTIPVALAFDKTEHRKQMESILFGRDNYATAQPKPQKDAIEALACAVYLCIDQYNGNGKEELRVLQEYKVPGLPSSIDKIDFQSNFHHRRYTHRGLNPDPLLEPPSEKGKWKQKWELRKKILLSTVNKVFGFVTPSIFNTIFGIELVYPKQCQAFCALVYYIHVLGDTVAIEDYSNYRWDGSDTLPLVRPHAGKTEPDILWDLTENCLPDLFSDSTKQSENYKTLNRKMESLSRDARALAGQIDGINSDERFSDYKKYAESLAELLKEYIPGLLQQEVFFTKVFPVERY